MVESPLELAQRAEWSEVGFVADSVEAAPTAVAHALGLGQRRSGRALASWCSAVDVLGYNRILGLGLDQEVEDLDALCAPFAEAGVPRFMVQLSPPALSLMPKLVERGFFALNLWAKLHRRAEPIAVPPTRLRISEIGPEHALAAAQIVTASFEHDPGLAPWLAALVGRKGWHHYVAFDNSLPVATGAMYVNGELAHLGFSGTLPSHRGLGAQSALIGHALAMASEFCCRWVVTETAEDRPEKPAPSFRNLRRVGFQVTYLRPNWAKVLRPHGGPAAP